MKKILYILMFLVLAALAWLYFAKAGDNMSLNQPGTPATQDEVVIEYPKQGDRVESPVKVAGQARGPWYFEASAPVKVIGAKGETLGGGYVTAQGEWMTTEFVPFEGSISFNKGGNKSGFLVFMNDNPSGEESRLKYTVVPVDF